MYKNLFFAIFIENRLIYFVIFNKGLLFKLVSNLLLFMISKAIEGCPIKNKILFM